MPDDIFDYFGGNSSRKVEPLDESEMFEDLLPKKAEPEAASNSEDEPEIIEAELVVQHSDDDQDDNLVNPESNDQESEAAPVPSNDPWNDLASSLGLQPAAVSANPSREADCTTVEDSFEDESAEQVDDETLPVEVFSVHREEDEEDEPAQEVLSEMFVPAEDPDAYSSQREPEDDLDDDPFAAFSGARRVDVADEDDEPEFDDVQSSGDEEIDSDPNFVEFEVKDLGGRVDEDREERKGRRRPRRRRRGGDEDRTDEPQREFSSSDDRESSRRPESRDDDRDRQDDERGRGRRGGRRRAKSAERDEETVQSDASDRDREPRGKSRSRGREREHDRLDDDDRMDDRDKKKKPRVPTWQEAIGVMIDANIKRHESNTNSGRGGRRRRRN